MILETITKGKIVSSEVTVKLLKRTIESNETDRFLIDGFPRSEENRVAYEQIVSYITTSFPLYFNNLNILFICSLKMKNLIMFCCYKLFVRLDWNRTGSCTFL